MALDKETLDTILNSKFVANGGIVILSFTFVGFMLWQLGQMATPLVLSIEKIPNQLESIRSDLRDCIRHSYLSEKKKKQVNSDG